MQHPKQTTFRSASWLRAVASLGYCTVCRTHTPTQAAHRNKGKGLGLKVHDCWTASICPSCHSELDQGASYTRDQRREIMDEAILVTIAILADRGIIAIAK